MSLSSNKAQQLSLRFAAANTNGRHCPNSDGSNLGVNHMGSPSKAFLAQFETLPLPSEPSSQASPSSFLHISEILPQVIEEIAEQAAQCQGSPDVGDRSYRCAA